MPIWFGRSVFERAWYGREEVGAAIEKSFRALCYELWGGGSRGVLEDWG